jgi:capsule polysaccharide export protein KpsE/RkpR
LVGGGYLSGLAGMAGFGGMATTSDVFAAILNSPRVHGQVVTRCDLFSIFETNSLEDAIGGLREVTKIEVSPEGIIKVSATAPTPELASRIANVFVDELDRFNRETTMSMGKRQRMFLEERLKDAEKSLADAEDALRKFQETHHTVSLTEQVTEAVAAAAHLKAEMIKKEVQLGVLERFATEENPRVKDLRSGLSELEEKLHEMEYGYDTENSEGAAASGPGFSIPFAKLPEVALQLARLTRDARIQEEVYAMLTQQYEQAKIEEVKDTPTIQILDEAVPPERRSHPQRRKIVVVAGILSLFTGLGMAFFFEYLEGLKNRPDEYRDWREILGQLVGDLKSFKSTILRR